MRPLQVRQAAVAGLVVSLLLAVLIASRSADVVVTFAVVCGVLLALWAVAVGVVVTVNRRRMRRVR